MANSEHLAKIKEGVKAWNEWRKANPKIFPDLREAVLTSAGLASADFSITDLSAADLNGANLTRADLYGAHLSGTHLGRAHLGRAYLDSADLSEANLREADLILAHLNGAHLDGADLSGAHLLSASLRGASLSGANVTDAGVGWTIFGDNDLSDVKGLETVRHRGPSTIGIDTIYRSHGNIPLAFLRGAGVPDNFIEYMGSLTGKALEFYSCFISYSTKDQKFAARLYADLQNNGVRCWFAKHDMQGGKYTIDQIDRAIQMQERLLLILSPKSMKSRWVETEIIKARKREVTEKRRVLFPIRLVPFKVIQDWKCFDSD
jgi:hypothetical protein